ncbi:hypothetical protein M8C21_023623, partial [Ambrosia artemisiifolia]
TLASKFSFNQRLDIASPKYLVKSSTPAKAIIVVALVIHMIGGVYSCSAASDHLSLLEIKSKITHDPQGALTSWNDSLPFCRWRGVTCGRRHQRVTMLNLPAMGLVGSLSPYLGNLSFLRYVIFDHNQLHGRIPPQIDRLHRLKVLSLANNSFTGEIPANMSSWPKLTFLSLRINKLSGKIPNTFTSLLMITTIMLGENEFTGGIPASLSNLTSLEVLSLYSCPLGGSIPDSFNQLKNLRRIGLSLNGLVGAFSSFFFNISTLEMLSLSQNQLHGSIPSNLCLSQPHLVLIELAINHFNGFLPPSITNCSGLIALDVSLNDLKGEIATDFGRLQQLNFLSLGGNSFGSSKDLDGMDFIHSLSNCSNLDTLELSDNQLGGVLPNSLGNFSSKLSYLAMGDNYLSGTIPSSIGNLLGLATLSLNENNFIGIIPESIGKLQNLRILYLYGNHLSGFIPRSIGNLSLLTKVTLGRNSLEGTIPSAIGSWKQVIDLDLYGNKLSGSVPKELFQLFSLSIALNLSQNNLSGVLPQEIGNLKLLGMLDFSMNRFTGELPSSLSSCISLQSLNLSGNLFYGSMPKSIGSMKGLEYVDLSRNNLSGHIPTYLQQIQLRYIDLSYNNFDGEVPVKGVFANTRAISIIGNTRLCGGIPELHLPKCTSTTSPKRRTRKLSVNVIVAVSVCSTVAGKKPIDPMFEEGLGLHSYARSALADGHVLHIVDPMFLSGDVNENSIISLVKIGVQCSYESPQDRMDIATVVHELLGTNIAIALVIHMIGAVYGSSSASDQLALLEIKSKITHDPQGALTSWNDSLPFCQWRGVTCGRRHQRVTILNLQGKGLVGSLSPFIGNMSFLRYINFDSNQLHGSIPPEIGHLYRLQSISLFNNSFTGEIPANMTSCPKLSSIDLEVNKLSGKIPNAFTSKLITFIALSDNELTGCIPPSIGNLTSLDTLSIADCHLGGSIPDSFNQLKNLRRIGLGSNRLVGAFPPFMFNLSMLEILSFSENQLEGSLPSNLCLSQPHLTWIGLGTNHISGFLPPSISNCSELETLVLPYNYLKGKIAIDFGRLQHLTSLSLGGNSFGSKELGDMNFFHSLSNCSNLKTMELSSNQLKGLLPNSLGNFSSKLSYLGMDDNYLLGSIPSSIGNLISLSAIFLDRNDFTVKIGVQCSYESPQDRMDIATVVRDLLGTTLGTRS